MRKEKTSKDRIMGERWREKRRKGKKEKKKIRLKGTAKLFPHNPCA